jgi:hypothetical protein
LDAFIEERRVNRVHILKRGALEDYPPPGYHAKDIDKLFRLLASDYWALLPEEGKAELRTISERLLGPPPVVAVPAPPMP